MITWVVDGKLCDGGPWGPAVGAGGAWPHGFGMFDPRLADIGTNVSDHHVGGEGAACAGVGRSLL